MQQITIDPTKVRNAGERILSLADILTIDGEFGTPGKRVGRTYEQSYWYAVGRMDEATTNHGSHAEADLFARARATAHHRMNRGDAPSTASMQEDYDNAVVAIETVA